MRAPFASNMVSRKNNRLNELRAEAAVLEQRAGRKMARVKRNTGAVVAGSNFDPRRDTSKVGRYNTRQLASYVQDLKTFNSRGTQFSSGVRGAPLPRAGRGGWQDYKAGESMLKTRFEQQIKPFENERLPGPGSKPGAIKLGSETIGQRAEKIRAKHPTTTNQGYKPPERQPFNVKDAESLNKLTKANRKRMTKKFMKDEHKRAREEFGRMVADFKDEGLTNSVATLSKGQFDILWNFTKFADSMSLAYHHIKSKYTAKQQMPQEIIDNQVNQAKVLIEWVRKFKV